MRLIEFAERQRSFAPEPRPLIPEPRAFLFESPTQNEPTKEEPESEGIFQRLSKLFDFSSRDEAPPAAPRPAAPSPPPAPFEQPRAPQVQPPEPQRQSAQQLALQPEQAQKLEPGPEQAQKLDPQPASPANPTTPASVPNASAFAYDVFGVNPGDTLNVRATPDHRAAKVAAILPTSTGLRSTGATRQAAGATWIELILPNGTGWVNRTYLVEQPTLSASSGGVRVSQVSPVCSDPEVTSLVRRFMDVVRKADGRGLKTLVSPVRGLSVRLRSDGPSVPFTYSEVSSLFTSNRVWSFGPAVNRGSPVAGTFRDVVLPTLAQVVQPEPGFLCEKLHFTQDLKDTEWPRELTGLLPYGIQANEAGYTLRWVLGIEFVEGKPYVATLVRYVGTLAPAHVANPTAPSPTPAAVAPPAPAAKEAPAPPSAPASKTDSKPAEKAKEPEPEAAKKAVESQPADKSATSDKSEKSRSKKDGDEKKKKKK